MQSFSITKAVLGAGIILLGLLNVVFPEQLAQRSNVLFTDPVANLWLVRALGVALIGAGFGIFSEPGDEETNPSAWPAVVAALIGILYFLLLSQHLREWWIDDAGITFAYSRSLAEGLGIRAQPWLPPEEGYSSSSWMLLLSFAHRLGADIPLAAKVLAIGFSVLCIVLCAVILVRESRNPVVVLLCSVGIASAPTAVWAVSGQEHALQALLLLGVVFCAYQFRHWHWPAAVILSVLVLTRPEAPVIVIGVFAAAVRLTRREGGPFFNAANLSIALLPFLTFLALMAFRLIYFGDMLPNPYYAKSSTASLTGPFNILGGGWSYVVSGLRNTGIFLVLAMVVLLLRRPLPSWIIVAFAVLASHIFFVIWAKGDWMGQYRFLMPSLPLFMLIGALGLNALTPARLRIGFGIVALLLIVQSTALQLAAFKMQPTTPMAAVTRVGDTFRTLADRLALENPVLAHHDAGGIAYHRMIRLVDLGGLVNRTIAKHMDDKAFLTDYLLEEVQPDFVFGARHFAASSGFSDTDRFAGDYVMLEFTGLDHMRTDLSYIRRDRVAQTPGITLSYDAAGRLTAVRADLRDASFPQPDGM